ncbi:unnamed protein product [Rotaria sp. Silwood1]|nr:unnamed protein product [Rotaria sp. Silwood1]
MSIIGGTKNFSLTDRLELKFLNSIINICIKSKVWMITNGFDTGIVQLVGRAIKKAQLKQSDKVIAIGICKWGSIKDVKALTKQKDPYISETLDKNDDDHKVKSGECYLEMNHTHYLIPRDLFKDYNEELEIDLKNILYGDNDLQKRKGLNSKIAKEKDERKLTDALNQVRYCLQPAVRSLITVFNLNSATDLSDQIFETLEISRDNGEKRNKPVPVLELAMDWDCIHVAKEFVLKDSLANIPNLEEAFIRALDKNLPAFVYEFLRLGIEPAEVLFPPIKLSSGQCRYKKVSGKCLSRGCSENLIGDYMHELYFETEEEETNDRIKWGLIKSSIQSKSFNYEDFHKKFQSYDEIRRNAQKYIMRDLFLWAILMNYIDMAKVFLSFLNYRICSAWIATKI